MRIVITTLGVGSSTPAGRMVFAVLAQLAEFERPALIERTNADLAAARKRGRRLGRRHSLTPHQQQEAKRRREKDNKTYAEIAALFGMPPAVVWRTAANASRFGEVAATCRQPASGSQAMNRLATSFRVWTWSYRSTAPLPGFVPGRGGKGSRVSPISCLKVSSMQTTGRFGS